MTMDTAAIITPSAQLTNLGAAMSLALLDATRPHPRRLCLVFDESYRDSVLRLLTTESIHSTFFVFTCGEPQRGRFPVDIDVPHTHTGILDTLATEVTIRPDRLTTVSR